VHILYRIGPAREKELIGKAACRAADFFVHDVHRDSR
jgi:hypothetical protein